MLHILYIIHSITLYGASRSVIELASELEKQGQKAFFFLPCEGRIEERQSLKRILKDAGISYMFLYYYPSVHTAQEKGRYPRKFRMRENKKCLQRMEEYARLWEIDIIHTNCFTHTIGAQLSNIVEKPHVWHIREALKNDFAMLYDSKRLYRTAIGKTTRVICISEYIAQTHRKMLSGSQVTVLHNGFDIHKYIIDNGFQRAPELFTLLICGSIREEKGQFDAVRAVENLVHHYQVKNIRLKLVGDGSKEYMEGIKSYIKRKKIESFVEILPFQLELKSIRKEADVALMCSKNEAFGRVTIESMLSENVVIGTNFAGTKEIIEDGVNGYLYEVGNIEDLSRKIYHVISHWNEQEKLVNRAKESAQAKYDIGRYAKKMLEIYEEVRKDYFQKEEGHSYYAGLRGLD